MTEFQNKESYISLADGMARVAAVYPKVQIANPVANIEPIIRAMRQESCRGTMVTVFPELCITGYTCGDLFLTDSLLSASEEALSEIREASSGLRGTFVVGLPVRVGTSLYNCAAIVAEGRIHGIVPKTYIPNYGEFYERRWFTPGRPFDQSFISLSGEKAIPFGTRQLFENREKILIGVEICEDLWVPNPPSTAMAIDGADLIVNLSASDEVLGKHRYLTDLIRQQSARCRCGYIYAGAGAGESSTDLAISGNAIIAEDNIILAEGVRFSREGTSVCADIDIERLRHDRIMYNSFSKSDIEQERKSCVIHAMNHSVEGNGLCIPEPPLLRKVDAHPFVPEDKRHLDDNCREVVSIQSWGLEQRMSATGCRHLVVGISGGLDSTLALLVACHAFDRLDLPRKGIIGVTMPGLATSDRTRNNATALMEQLGITSLEIPIGDAVAQHFKDIDQNPELHDATFENSQARERTQILMDLANKYGGMVLGTGDLSELALGWCTYNGDQMSMYGVNASVPKTLVKHLVGWFAEYHSDEESSRILRDIVATPISPELIPGDDEEIAQRTEDLIGPYELHDFYLYHMLRYGSRPKKIYRLAKTAFEGVYPSSTIKKWLVSFYRRFFSQQFKRSCMPDGPKTGSVCLSPRGDWRMPSDASSRLWLNEAESLEAD